MVRYLVLLVLEENMSHLPTIIPASQARSNFYDLLDEVSKTFKRFIITKHGRAQAVILSPEEVESLEETNEILADKRLMRSLRQGEEDIKKGRYITLEQFKKELKLNV